MDIGGKKEQWIVPLRSLWLVCPAGEAIQGELHYDLTQIR